MKQNCIFLHATFGEPPLIWRRLAKEGRAITVPQYELSSERLAPAAALVVGMHADQRFLAGCRTMLEAWLERGRTLVINGHIAHPMLPELGRFVPPQGTGIAALRLTRLRDHPVFEGVPVPALQTRRGVMGFYGRGHNPMPANGRALHGIGPDAMPVDWVYERPQGGRLFVHGGNDLWGSCEDRALNDRLLAQLVTWAVGVDTQQQGAAA